MAFLETERLILRPFEDTDFPAFWAYANDAEMSRMMGRPDMSSRENAYACFSWLKDREERAYCMVLKESGQVVGNLTITQPPEEVRNLPAVAHKPGRSLSFCVGKPWQRQGLAEEALRAVIEELYERENVSYINCGHFAFNEASRRLQEKLGFARLAELRVPTEAGEVTAYENIRWRDYFIKTPRLTLRRFRTGDFEDYCAYAMDSEMARMIGLDDMPNRDAARRGFEKAMRRPRAYALVLESEGKVVGDLAVEPVPPGVENAPVIRGKRGYALSFAIGRDYRRRGLMEEAVRGTMTQLFEGENLDFVNCGYFDYNEASRRLQNKLGFVPLATHLYHRGSEKIRVVDNVMWKENWLREEEV